MNKSSHGPGKDQTNMRGCTVLLSMLLNKFVLFGMFIRMLLHFAAFVSIYLNKLFFECRGYRGRFYLDISNVVVCFHNVDGKQQNVLIADYALN